MLFSILFNVLCSSLLFFLTTIMLVFSFVSMLALCVVFALNVVVLLVISNEFWKCESQQFKIQAMSSRSDQNTVDLQLV